MRYILLFSLLAFSAYAQSVGDFSLNYKANATGPLSIKSWAKANSTLWGTNSSGNPQSITLGTGLSLDAGVLTAPGGGTGSGTVTSVALTMPNIFSVTGSPITASGTLAASLATQSANRLFAGPATGSAATPTFRALVATDIPDLSAVYQPLITDGSLTIARTSGLQAALDAKLSTTAAASAYQPLSNNLTTLSSGLGAGFIPQLVTWDGTTYARLNGALSTGLGGTGLQTYAIGDMLYVNPTGSMARLAGNTSTTKKFLSMTGNGTSALDPVWGTIQAADVPTLNQSTTGSAATLTTPRAINGVDFDGSAAITVTAAADTLTGTTLASNVVSSSLTSVGAITSGTWTATAVAVANGGTGATTQSGARTNLGLGNAAVYNTSAGGNGAADDDALAIYRSTGALYASDVVQVMPTSGTFPRMGYNYNRISFEQTGGSGVLQPTTLTDVWTWTLPNAGGTIITTGNLSSITAVGTLASGAVPVSLITGLGTGISAALAINTGSAGAPVLFNGALGTPSSGTLTSCTVKAEIVVACSDETTSLTTGTAKVTFRMPHAMTLSSVRLQVNTAPTGSVIIVDVKEAGTTVFSTKPQIATSAFTSVGGAVPGTLSDTALADDAEITINLDQIGSTIAGKGLKITLVGTRQ